MSPRSVYSLGQIFSWSPSEGAERTSWNVTAIMRAISEKTVPAELVLTAIDESFARQLPALRSVQERYAFSLPTHRLKEPLLGAILDDGEVLLMDGAHRYYALYRIGVAFAPIYLIEAKFLKAFEVPDPDSLPVFDPADAEHHKGRQVYVLPDAETYVGDRVMVVPVPQGKQGGE